MSKRAFITGVNGQDGSYLAEFLLGKGYEVHGLLRRSSVFTTERVDALKEDSEVKDRKFFTHWGDVTDSSNLRRLITQIEPHEVYNLAAQSHVKVSFEVPEHTGDTDALGALRLLDAVRDSGLHTRFYQASTSEMFGQAPPPQNEDTRFSPRSPYAAAKAYAHWIVRNYREAYEMFACNGILFNHESERRGKTFVTRKITRAAARIEVGLQDRLYLGNLDAQRDWGYAPEYVEAMWLMLQQPEPDDYVIATNETHTVREFAALAFKAAGIDVTWEGEGLEEKGVEAGTGRTLVEIRPRYFRPTEVDVLQGDASKAARELGWRPRTSFRELVATMVRYDLAEAKKELASR